MPKSTSFGWPSESKDIRRFQVAVNNQLLVRVRDPVADFEHQAT